MRFVHKVFQHQNDCILNHATTATVVRLCQQKRNSGWGRGLERGDWYSWRARCEWQAVCRVLPRRIILASKGTLRWTTVYPNPNLIVSANRPSERCRTINL